MQALPELVHYIGFTANRGSNRVTTSSLVPFCSRTRLNTTQMYLTCDRTYVPSSLHLPPYYVSLNYHSCICLVISSSSQHRTVQCSNSRPSCLDQWPSRHWQTRGRERARGSRRLYCRDLRLFTHGLLSSHLVESSLSRVYGRNSRS